MRSFHGFKKIAADQNSTTFAHPNGSRLMVAHSSLDPKTLKRISALPMATGGEVPVSMPDPQKARDAAAGLEKGETFTEGWQNLKTEFGFGNNEQKTAPQPAKQGYACGGKVQKFAGESGEPADSEVLPDLSQIDPNSSMPSIPAQFYGSRAMAPSSAALANPAAYAPSSNPLSDSIKYAGQALMAPAGTAPEFKPSETKSEAAPEQAAPTNVNIAPQSTGPGFRMPVAGQDYDPYQGLNTQMAGVQGEANAIGDLEKVKAQALEQNQKDMAALNYQAQQNAWNNQVETQNMIDDMKNSHIDPKAYVNNMSSGQKAGTAIGLLLGGMSGGLLHTGVNPAMDFLNKQIDRDINAQIANRNNKETIFNAMQKQYGNQVDATKMTHAFYLAKLQNDIGIAAAKSGSPIAQARAQQIMGPLQSQLQQIHLEVGMRQAALNGLSTGQNVSAALPFLVHDKSKVEDAAKAYGKAVSLNEQQKNILQSFDQIHSKFMNGLFSPNDTASAKQAFTGTLQVALEKRYNAEAVKGLSNAIFPEKTDTSEQTVQNKRNRLIEEFNGARAEEDAVLRGLTNGLVGAPKPPPSGFRKR